MEDFLPLLITILIGVVPIVFSGKKSRKNIRYNTPEPPSVRLEKPLIQEFSDSTDNAKTVTVSPASEVAPMPGMSTSDTSATSEKGGKVPLKIDPKKLVIYSEIMRPKYLE